MHHAVQLGTSQISFKFILQHHNDQTFPYIVNLFLKNPSVRKGIMLNMLKVLKDP